MKFSQIKKVYKFCNELFSTPDPRAVMENLVNGDEDFTVDDVRFIADSAIDAIQCEELQNDDYILGCFNAWFLADVTGLDVAVFEVMQKAEAYEAIGKLIKSLNKMQELQSEYARADGYGHHFNSYDFGKEELTVDGRLFHVFDNH